MNSEEKHFDKVTWSLGTRGYPASLSVIKIPPWKIQQGNGGTTLSLFFWATNHRHQKVITVFIYSPYLHLFSLQRAYRKGNLLFCAHFFINHSIIFSILFCCNPSLHLFRKQRELFTIQKCHLSCHRRLPSCTKFNVLRVEE